MGVRFRKSVSLGGGVKLNVSKKSVGLSAGTKGARISANSSGRKTVSGSIPGTGLYASKSIGGGRPRSSDAYAPDFESATASQTGFSNRFMGGALSVFSVILILFSALLTLAIPIVGIAGIVLGVVFFCLGRMYKRMYTAQLNSNSGSPDKE